jgi:conjugal transfer pilus assembly protein TraW
VIITRISGSLLLVLILAAAVQGKDLGTTGATYAIVEKDALREIEDRAKEINWATAFDRTKTEESIKNYHPEGMEAIPIAGKDRIFSVDMTYTLDFDIPDGKGGIIYPRGYRFNPLDYVFLPNILVVIDGADARQIKWFQMSSYAKDIRVMLLLSGGSYQTVMEKLKRPVFYANGKITTKFQLKAVPAIIVQKGTVMEVREYALKDNGQKKKK